MEQRLPAGGKEVLIKSVAQAILTYSMVCFKLPRGLCEHIKFFDPEILVGKRKWQGEVTEEQFQTFVETNKEFNY